MSKVMVVTDSTSNIPAELMENNPIRVLPLQVIWDDQILRDGVDIQPIEFYQRLQKSATMPTTSQTTPEEFKQAYSSLIEEGYDILSLHISSKLSGTIDSAIQAKQAFPTANIEVVDSLSVSMAMSFQVMAAARVAAAGGSLQDCKAVAEKAKEQSGIYFTLNTLEFLHRGGRIGGGAAFLGTMLNLKPILMLENGRIEAVERVRTMNKSIERLLELVEVKLNNDPGPVRLCAVHGNAFEEANMLLNRAIKRFSSSLVRETLISDISPVLGTHTGPGALGLAFMVGM